MPARNSNLNTIEFCMTAELIAGSLLKALGKIEVALCFLAREACHLAWLQQCLDSCRKG